MLNELAARLKQSAQLRVLLLFGVRQPEDLLYREEFIAFADQQPRFEFRAYYSRARCHERYEHQGHVQTAFADIQLDAEKDIVYLCGNPNMIDEAFALLAERNFSAQNVRREKYISSS
jgi:NAD(P)H-flavin reductase